MNRVSSTTTYWSQWPVMLVIVLMTFTAYLPALNGDFIWDDDFEVVNNTLLKAPDALKQIWLHRISFTAKGPQYYPLTTTTFWLERWLWGLQPMGYHIVNVLLHAINAVLLFMLLKRLGVPGAWLAGAIFAVHPVHVESVAWITERKNLLSGMFYLLSIGSYLRFEEDQRWCWYVGSVGLFALALLSKTSTVMLPVVLLLCIWWLQRPWGWRGMRRVLPFFALSAVAAAGTILFEQHSVGADGIEWSAGIVERIAIAGRIVWFYLSKIFIPYNLTFIYPRWSIDPWLISSYLPSFGLLALLVVSWRQRRGLGRPILVGLGYFVVNLFPVLGFFNIYFMRYSFVADHFQYLASMGIIAFSVGVVVWGFERWGLSQAKIRGYKLEVGLGVAVLLVLGVLTWRQGQIYTDEETLWRDTVDKNPQAWMAYNNLGYVYFTQGRIEEAIEEYKISLKIRQNSAIPHTNLGLIYFNQGRIEEAVKEYQIALRIRPTHVEAHYNLGIAYSKQGLLDEALEEYKSAIRLNPDLAKAHVEMGIIYGEKGLLEDALEEFKTAIGIRPDYSEAHNNLGNIYLTQRKLFLAIKEYEEALSLNPDNVVAYYNLAMAYEGVGSREAAMEYYRRFIEIAPLEEYKLIIERAKKRFQKLSP